MIFYDQSMSYRTRLEVAQRNSKTLNFISVVGHGTLINPLNASYQNISPSFEVPSDTTVIFISKPGYWIPLRSLRDSKMMSLLRSRRKLRQLIADKLPARDTPRIITRAGWSWKNHIYTPGMICPNMGLEFYDAAQTSWGRWYNEQSGVRYVGSGGAPKYKGRKKSLKNLISEMRPRGIFIVFGCRGDPAAYRETGAAFEARHGTSRGPFPWVGNRSGRQNYRVPRTALTEAARTQENQSRRYLGVKRIRNNNFTVRKPRSGNTPPAKRARTSEAPAAPVRINTPRFTFHPGRPPTPPRRPRTGTVRTRPGTRRS
jgi:hypothetical protein